MTGIVNWLGQSNRYKHLVGGILIGLCAGSTYCALYAGAGVAGAMEFKDKQHGGKWDWYDFGCTFVGAIIGRAAVLGVRWMIGGHGV